MTIPMLLLLLTAATATPAPSAAGPAKAGPPPAAAETPAGPMVHVRVAGPGKDDGLSVDVPFTLARFLVGLAGEKAVESGRIEYEGRQLAVSDLREAWKSVRASGGSVVTLKQPEQLVKLGVAEGFLKLVVAERAGASDVEIEVPVSAVDALLSGDGNRLDVTAALDALEGFRGKDAVRVRDGATNVRIWID